jgi:hypothetical protein
MDETGTRQATVNVRDCGATGDGRTHDTEAIGAAIEQATQPGGPGHVLVPPGTYLTGTVRLQSHLVFELRPGATLMASPDPDQYPPLPVQPGFPDQHLRGRTHRRHLLCGDDLEDVRLCGGGAIDGNVAAFVPDYDNRPPFRWFGGQGRPFLPMVNFRRCRRLGIDGIRLGRTTGWTCHLDQCDGVTVRGVELENDLYAGGSDGFDVNGCRDVMFADCRITTGDDAIVLKSFRHGRGCERIAITNCVLRSTCAAVKVGTESFHDFRQITISNVVVHGSSRAVQLMSQDGATIEDVTVSNVVCDTNSGVNLNRPIHLDVHRRRHGHAGADPSGSRPVGAMRRVTISGVTLATDGRILMTAADGALLEQITLRDVAMHLPWIEDPVAVRDLSDRMQSSPGNPDARLARAAVVAENVRDLALHNVTIRWPDGRPLPESYQPKYEGGQLVIDPRAADAESPTFHALWARGITGGTIDMPGATASRDGVEPILLEDCDVVVRQDDG